MLFRSDPISDRTAEKRFFAGSKPFNRPAGDTAGRRGHRKDKVSSGFIPETSSHLRDVYPDGAYRPMVNLSQHFSYHEGTDTGEPRLNYPIPFKPDNRSMRFNRSGDGKRIIKFTFDSNIGIGNPLIEVPLLQYLMIDNIGPGKMIPAGGILFREIGRASCRERV